LCSNPHFIDLSHQQLIRDHERAEEEGIHREPAHADPLHDLEHQLDREEAGDGGGRHGDDDRNRAAHFGDALDELRAEGNAGGRGFIVHILEIQHGGAEDRGNGHEEGEIRCAPARQAGEHAAADGAARTGQARSDGHGLHAAHDDGVEGGDLLVLIHAQPVDRLAQYQYEAGHQEGEAEVRALKQLVDDIAQEQGGKHRRDGRQHQILELRCDGVNDHVPDALPVHSKHRKQRADVQQDIQRHRNIADSKEHLPQCQVSRRTDRQKLSQALNQTQKKCLNFSQPGSPPEK